MKKVIATLVCILFLSVSSMAVSGAYDGEGGYGRVGYTQSIQPFFDQPEDDTTKQ
ncbi:MAG: hypothetical protein FWC16_00360 [Defluviitaleaceae bacterium]|nr:hypothetical protein [Defluviitaleaceae bacterium]MCL2273355.1 hypothetical protein [Defluviitaleaceae bacterium]